MCDICRKPIGDPVELGDLMKLKDISVHYYCLLLSTNLPQRGEDKSGILGFLVRDIRQEIEKSSKRACVYCTEQYASIKCHDCEDYFHAVCGLQNDCLFQFTDEFLSFCKIHTKINHTETHTPCHGCYICLEYMGNYNPVTSITSECCGKGWVHRYCLKKYALTSGYYLKCLWCAEPNFRNYVRLVGIFVPDRDALWEKEKKAYAGLYENYCRCDATICFCKKGRTFSSSGKWKMHTCSHCGSFGIHEFCKVDESMEDFICKTCLPISEYLKRKPKNITKEQTTLFDGTLYQTKSLALFQDDTGEGYSKHNSAGFASVKRTMFSICAESINYNYINNLNEITNIESTIGNDPTLNNIAPESKSLPVNESEDTVTKASLLIDLRNGELLGFRSRKMKKSEDYIKYFTEDDLKSIEKSDNKFIGFSNEEIDFSLLDKIVAEISSPKPKEPKSRSIIKNDNTITRHKNVYKGDKDFLLGVYFDRMDPDAAKPSFNI